MKLKKRYWKIIGFTSLFVASLVSAITVPLVMESQRKHYLNLNHSTDTLEGNKSRINYYIDNLEQYILKLAINYKTEINLLLTIPGIKEISAIFIIDNGNEFYENQYNWGTIT